MKRLGPFLALTLGSLAVLVVAPADAAATVHVAGVVTVAGQPVAGAFVTLGSTRVTSGPGGSYAADVPAGATPLTLEVSTPHAVRDTTAAYHGTLDLTSDRALDLAVPGDRATTMTVTEADGATPVVHAEYDLFHGPGVKLVPAVGPFDYVTDVQHGADDAITDGAGRATFFVPDWSTTDRQTATLTAYDPGYTRPEVSTQVAYPATPATIALRFPAASAPSAPRSLTVSGLTPTTATFAWTVPASQGSAYVESYRVSYGPTGAQGRVVDVPATSETGGQLQVTDLKPGGGYSVDVRAVSAAGTSPATGTSFTTPKYAVQARVLSVSPVQPVSGQPATLTIDVAGGGTAYAVSGTVTLYDGGVALTTAALSNGRATVSRSFLAGTHALTVGYSGDSTHLSTSAGGSSPTTTLSVAKGSTTTSATTSSTGKGSNRDVTVRVDVRAALPASGTPTGTVTVRDSVTGTTRTLTLSGGTTSTTYTLRTKQTVTFTVTYTGSTELNGSSTTVSVKL